MFIYLNHVRTQGLVRRQRRCKPLDGPDRGEDQSEAYKDHATASDLWRSKKIQYTPDDHGWHNEIVHIQGEHFKGESSPDIRTKHDADGLTERDQTGGSKSHCEDHDGGTAVNEGGDNGPCHDALDWGAREVMKPSLDFLICNIK